MSALFNFQSLMTVFLLLICTCAYVRSIVPRLIDRKKVGTVWAAYFGNVQGLVNEKVLTLQWDVFLWHLAYYFGREDGNQLLMHESINI